MVASAREPLSREAVLRAAIGLADAGGIGAVTMRRVGQELGVEAMTLYYHVGNKDRLLDGMLNLVLGEIELPGQGDEWKGALRRIALSAHDVLDRHPWAAALMLTPGRSSEARVRYMEALLGTLRRGGFSPNVTDHAYHALDSYVAGFTLWLAQMALVPDELPALAAEFLRRHPADEYPYVVEHVHHHLGARNSDDEGSFAFGLDLILEGLERLRPRS